MPNSFGTLSTGLILQRALELIFTKRPILNRLALDFSDERVDFGATITSRIKAVATVNNFGTGAVDRTDTDVPVTINQFKEVHHAFTIQELSSTKRDLVDESAEPFAVAIANHMVDSLAALWVAANFTNSTTVASGWNYNTLTTLRQALIGRGVPESQRFGAVSAAVYKSLLDDTTIVATQNNPNSGAPIQEGVLTRVAGFDVFEYPGLPTTGNMVGFFGVKDSAVMALRLPKDADSIAGLGKIPFPGNTGVVREPRTGMSLMVDEWINPADRKVNVRMAWMYGLAKGNGNNGQILKTA